MRPVQLPRSLACRSACPSCSTGTPRSDQPRPGTPSRLRACIGMLVAQPVACTDAARLAGAAGLEEGGLLGRQRFTELHALQQVAAAGLDAGRSRLGLGGRWFDCRGPGWRGGRRRLGPLRRRHCRRGGWRHRRWGRCHGDRRCGRFNPHWGSSRSGQRGRRLGGISPLRRLGRPGPGHQQPRRQGQHGHAGSGRQRHPGRLASGAGGRRPGRHGHRCGRRRVARRGGLAAGQRRRVRGWRRCRSGGRAGRGSRWRRRHRHRAGRRHRSLRGGLTRRAGG